MARNALVAVRRLASIALVCLLAASTAVWPRRPRAACHATSVEGLSAGKASGFRVILQGSAATVDDAVQRYGVRVTKQLKTGAVIEVTREALEAMSADPAIGHLAGDTLVKSMMAVSTQAMGADQAWAGLLPGVPAGDGPRHRRGGDRLRRGADHRPEGPHRGRRRLHRASRATAKTTATARTSPGSSAARRRRVPRRGAGGEPGQPARCSARRLRAHERRDCGHRLGRPAPRRTSASGSSTSRSATR